jgi:hypothetical protein
VKLLGERDDLTVVGASPYDEGAVADFAGRTGARYPMLTGLTDEAREAWGVRGYPALVVIDRTGRIAGRGIEALRSALAE